MFETIEMLVWLSAVSAGVVKFVESVPNIHIPEKWINFVVYTVGLVISIAYYVYTGMNGSVFPLILQGLVVGFTTIPAYCAIGKLEEICKKEVMQNDEQNT